MAARTTPQQTITVTENTEAWQENPTPTTAREDEWTKRYEELIAGRSVFITARSKAAIQGSLNRPGRTIRVLIKEGTINGQPVFKVTAAPPETPAPEETPAPVEGTTEAS